MCDGRWEKTICEQLHEILLVVKARAIDDLNLVHSIRMNDRHRLCKLFGRIMLTRIAVVHEAEVKPDGRQIRLYEMVAIPKLDPMKWI